MKIPKSERRLLDFAIELIETCTYSQADRAAAAATYLAYYEQGTAEGKPSLYNRTGVHIDRTSSYLYAPGEVRYSLAYDATDGEPWITRAKIASRYLSREYRRSDADLLFSQGIDISLIKGCSLMKHNWMDTASLYPGFSPFITHPEFFGVEREDLERLSDQQAMCETTYLSKNQIKQMVVGRPDEEEVNKKIAKMGGTTDSQLRQNWLHQVVIGGVTPVPSNTPDNTRGQVSLSPSSQTQLSPDMMADLLRMDELWVVNDDQQDYSVIQIIEGELILEGRYRLRNLTGVKGMLPWSKICPDPVSGYFWGRSEVGRVQLLQDLLSEAMDDIRRLMKLRVRPPKAFIGFQGLTNQKMRALRAPGGYIQEQTPNAKIEDLSPKIPEELFREVMQLSEMFDEVGGFKPIMQGQGESGVRAGSHAKTLLRTASPNLKKRAMRAERNAEDSADITFQLMQAKVNRVFKSEEEEFRLAQIPEDHYVEVDSHSSTPAFVDDEREIAVALMKFQAIDAVEFIEMMHPPSPDNLIAGAKKRQAARAKMLQDHPELIAGKGKK